MAHEVGQVDSPHTFCQLQIPASPLKLIIADRVEVPIHSDNQSVNPSHNAKAPLICNSEKSLLTGSAGSTAVCMADTVQCNKNMTSEGKNLDVLLLEDHPGAG